MSVTGKEPKPATPDPILPAPVGEDGFMQDEEGLPDDSDDDEEDVDETSAGGLHYPDEADPGGKETGR